MQKNFARFAALACVLLTLAAFTGCGPNDGLNEVSGTVTLDGEPIASGYISMGPMAGQRGTAVGGEILNGKYKLRASAGEMVVSIRSQQKVNIDGDQTADEAAHGVTERQVELVPERYNRQSELKCTVSEGKNLRDFVLTTDAEAE